MKQQSIKSNRKRSTAAIKFNDTAIDIQYPKDDDQLFIIVDAIMEILTNKDKLSDLIITYMQEHEAPYIDEKNKTQSSSIDVAPLNDDMLSVLDMSDVGIIVSEILNDRS